MRYLKKISIFMCAVLAMTAIFSTAAFADEEQVTSGSGNSWDWIYGDYDPWSTNKVGFFIQIDGEQMDVEGNVTGRDKKFFTDILDETTLKQSLSDSFQKTWPVGTSNSDISDYISALPNTSDVFEKVVKTYEAMDAYIRSTDGKIVPWSKMNSKYYSLHWYVLKKESDFWHVDGVIIDKLTDKEIQIVVPEEKAERTACVEYDVNSGEYKPGFMGVKANRPHSYWSGDNDTAIIDGFHDVWYTVLDEATFETNTAVIPSDLINAASAVAQLAGARLTELDSKLQKQYGRIDSQAYKDEYIERTGSGTTLYVTPFISEMLSSKYGVDTNKYIWLAMGDSQGNIEKVYVMDRELADVENLFDGE